MLSMCEEIESEIKLVLTQFNSIYENSFGFVNFSHQLEVFRDGAPNRTS